MPINPGGSFSVAGAPFPGYGSGRYYGPTVPGLTGASRALTANKIYAMPFFIKQTQTFAGISVYQDNVSPTGNIRLGVYNDSSGAPATKNTDAGTVAFPGSTGIRTVTASIALTAGTWYWLVAVADAALSVSGWGYIPSEGFLNYSQADRGIIASAITILDGVTTYQGWLPIRGAHVYAALPSSFPTPETYVLEAPMIFLKT